VTYQKSIRSQSVSLILAYMSPVVARFMSLFISISKRESCSTND